MAGALGTVLMVTKHAGRLAPDSTLVWLRSPLAPFAASGIGIALLAWLAVQIAVIGYSNSPPLQPNYLLVGAAITGVGLTWLAGVRRSALQTR